MAQDPLWWKSMDGLPWGSGLVKVYLSSSGPNDKPKSWRGFMGRSVGDPKEATRLNPNWMTAFPWLGMWSSLQTSPFQLYTLVPL